jgi:hypothetical protein
MKDLGSGKTMARNVYIEGNNGAIEADVVSTAKPNWTTPLEAISRCHF